MRPLTNNNNKKYKPDPLAAKFKRNEGITSPEVRLIDEESNPVGIVTLAEALKRAQEADLDLVEVAPTAVPPVCKIISWSKFKYDQSKKMRNTTSKTQLKEVRFGALIGENDRVHKTKRIKEFLSDKHLVRIQVRTPGRIKIEQSRIVMTKVLDDIYEYGELESPVKQEGNSIVAMVKPLKTKRVRPVVEEQTDEYN